MCRIWLLFQRVQVVHTGAPRVRCQATRATRPTVTLSLISVTPCHRSMPRSHATATHLRGSTGSCGTRPSGRRKRRRSGCWNVWRGKKKGARPATGAAWVAQATFAPPTLSAESCQQTQTRSAPTTNPGHPCFILMFIKKKTKNKSLICLHVLFQLSEPYQDTLQFSGKKLTLCNKNIGNMCGKR